MKQKLLIIVMTLIFILIIAIIAILFDSSSKLVLKCEYNTNLMNAQNGDYFSIGFDEEIFFINTRKKTINNKNWEIDKQYKFARLKVGDGTTKLKDLPFFIDSAIDTYITNKRFNEVIDAGRITEYK